MFISDGSCIAMKKGLRKWLAVRRVNDADRSIRHDGNSRRTIDAAWIAAVVVVMVVVFVVVVTKWNVVVDVSDSATETKLQGLFYRIFITAQYLQNVWGALPERVFGAEPTPKSNLMHLALKFDTRWQHFLLIFRRINQTLSFFDSTFCLLVCTKSAGRYG